MFNTTKFMFAVFKEYDGEYHFENIKFWNMPVSILDNDVKSVWDKTKMIIKYIEENGSINNEQCREITWYERTKSAELLSNLVSAGIIVRNGSGKSTYYVLKK